MKQFSYPLKMKSKSSRKVKESDHETGLQGLQNEEATVQSHNDEAENLPWSKSEGVY
jgi:GMP synthase-like glutamine amidotransferase